MKYSPCLSVLFDLISRPIPHVWAAGKTIALSFVLWDLGKVYTLLGCLEAAVPLAASPLLTIIYNNTIDTFTGAVYLAEAGFMLVVLTLFIVIIILFSLHQSRYSSVPSWNSIKKIVKIVISV